MKTKILMAAVLAGLVATAGAAQAQNGRERPDFATLDADGDGAITLEELQAQGEVRFAGIDTDGDGGLSAEEIAAAASERAAERAATRAARMIERHDDNGDGILQQDEMPTRGGDRAERMFDHVDADEDGSISQEEFEAAAERGEGRRGRGEGRGNGRDGHKGRG